MQTEIFALCDAATAYGGRLNLLGVFNEIHAQSFPVQHPHCALAVKVRFSDNENGPHELHCRIIDLDGHDVVPSLLFQIPERPAATAEHVHSHIWEINGLMIPRAGEFSVDLLLDGELKGRIPLRVVTAG